MKKIIILLAILFSLFCLPSCKGMAYNVAGFKKRNCSNMNISVRLPKTWKRPNNEVLKYYIPPVEVNPFGMFLEGNKYKFDGYFQNETSYIIFRQAKISDVFNNDIEIYSLNDLMRVLEFHPNNYTSKLIDVNGTSFYIQVVDFISSGRAFGVGIKNGYIYIIDFCLIDAFPYNETSIEEMVYDTMNIGTNGFVSGFWDGLLFVPKFIIHWFNRNVRFFASANNGFTYIAGFIIGILLMLVPLGKIMDN